MASSCSGSSTTYTVAIGAGRSVRGVVTFNRTTLRLANLSPAFRTQIHVGCDSVRRFLRKSPTETMPAPKKLHTDFACTLRLVRFGADCAVSRTRLLMLPGHRGEIQWIEKQFVGL
jgi:hypothetical protein